MSVRRLSVCLSDAYIGNNSRTERPRKTNIGTQVAHITHDSDSTIKVKGQLGEAWEYCGGLTYSTSLIFINSFIFMAPTAIGSKVRWATQPSGMGCSWAAASGVQRAGAYCVATPTACYKLVRLSIYLAV